MHLEVQRMGLPRLDCRAAPSLNSSRPPWLERATQCLDMRAHIVDYWAGGAAQVSVMQKYLKYLGFQVTVDQSAVQIGVSCGYVSARNAVKFQLSLISDTAPDMRDSVHNEWIVHGSGGNETDGWRHTYVCAFRDERMVAYERARGFRHSYNDTEALQRLRDHAQQRLATAAK